MASDIAIEETPKYTNHTGNTKLEDRTLVSKREKLEERSPTVEKSTVLALSWLLRRPRYLHEQVIAFLYYCFLLLAPEASSPP